METHHRKAVFAPHLFEGGDAVFILWAHIRYSFFFELHMRLAEFHRNLREDVNPDSHWTNYIPGLDRKLYKNKS